MCDLEGILAGCDGIGVDVDDDVNEGMEAIGEINGQRRKVTVLRKTSTFTPSMSELPLNGRPLVNRTAKVKFIKEATLPLDASGSVQAQVKWEWGGEENKVSGGIQVEVNDDKGNYATVKIEQNSDGKGSAEVAAGHKEE